MDDLEKAIDSTARCIFALDNAIRQGTEEDKPEGRRFIILSDTLAKQMSTILHDAIDSIMSHAEKEKSQ